MVHCPAGPYIGDLSDFRPRCSVHAELMSLTRAPTAYHARQYLQQNALAVMRANAARALAASGPCWPCPRAPTDPGTMLPLRYEWRCTPTTCQRVEVNPNGLGDGWRAV